MRVLITGACGFVGSTLAKAFTDAVPRLDVTGLDNLIRPGSERNRRTLLSAGVDLRHVDIRAPSDFENLPGVDWVIDAAANPSVLAGIDAKTSSRQLVEHNLYGTVNLLEFCKQHRAGKAWPKPSARQLPCPCMAARNWPRRFWRQSTPRRLESRCGSTGVAYSLEQGNSAAPIKASLPSGSTPGSGSAR